jgi:YD repeat-containing protein
MALTNGMKFFSIALTLVLLTSCNREETSAKIYFKVKNPKDYTDNDYKFEALTPEKVSLWVAYPEDLSNFTFYDRNHHLIRRATIEEEAFDDRYFRGAIQNGKLHGFLRVYEKIKSIVKSEVYKYLKGEFQKVDDENLQLKAEYCFHQGIRHGKYRKFEDGCLIQTGQYYFGHQIGKEKKYYTSGALRGIAQYKHGQIVTEKTYHSNGKINSQVQYHHDGREIHSEKYNNEGLLVEEHSIKDGAQITRVYDFDTKSYKTYKVDDNDHFVGSYYSTFDDEGDFEFAIDISKLKAGIILLKYPNKSIQCKVANGALASAIVEVEIGASKYVYDDKLTSAKRYEGNKLVGIYFPKTKEVRGEIDYRLFDNPPKLIDQQFEQCLRDLLKDCEENKLSIFDLNSFEDIYVMVFR